MAVFKHDVPGIYARFVHGLNLRNVSVRWDGGLPEWCTSAVHCEQFEHLEIDGLTARPAHADGEAPVVALNDGRDVAVRNCRALEGGKTFLEHRNIERNGLFIANKLDHAEQDIKPDPSLWERGGRNESPGTGQRNQSK